MYVWISSRRIKKGKMEEYKKTWEQHWWPKGLKRVFWLVSMEDENEMIGLSVWESREAIDEAKKQEIEKARGRSGEPYVEKFHSKRIYNAQEYLPPSQH
jgi:heme-degrading monooxygenase HmoA